MKMHGEMLNKHVIIYYSQCVKSSLIKPKCRCGTKQKKTHVVKQG